MVSIWRKYRKPSIVFGMVLLLVVLFVYLRAMFLPGLWHGDAFLYQKEDGSFFGEDYYAEYHMTRKLTEYGAEITFSVNDRVHYYEIKYDKNDLSRRVEILENGTVVCQGHAIGNENDWFVIADEPWGSDMVSVRVGNEAPTEEELFPKQGSLYQWAISEKTDTRGNPYMLFLILLIGLLLFLDIRFPRLFWILEHKLEVDGGEPSDWYLFGQKMGRVILVAAIPVCMILTFTIH